MLEFPSHRSFPTRPKHVEQPRPLGALRPALLQLQPRNKSETYAKGHVVSVTVGNLQVN